MKAILLLLLIVATSLAVPVANTDVYVGDSIMAGNELNHSGQGGSNDAFSRWTRAYTVGIKAGTEENQAQSGRTLCKAFDNSNNFEDVKGNVPAYNSTVHRLLFFSFSFNDVFKGGGYAAVHTTFVAKYVEMIQYLITTKGWPAGSIIINWYFYPIDLPAYNFNAADFRTLWNEVKAAVVVPLGTGFIDWHPFWDARSDKADYSLNTYTNDRDYIHPQNAANATMAANVDALIQYPSGPTQVRGRRIISN